MIYRATIGVTLGALAIVFIAALALCTRADAAARCAPVDEQMAFLSGYGESPVAVANINDATPVVFTANAETGTWSMGVAQGQMLCIMAVGDGWHPVDMPPPEPTVPRTAL